MALSALREEDYWNVEISWTRPKKYEAIITQGSIYDDEAQLYMISGRYGKYPHKLFYLGKTYSQSVSKRITQPDHQKRYNMLKKRHPKHVLCISHGIVSIEGGRIVYDRLKEIENILVYTSAISTNSINIANTVQHGVKKPYYIYNKGSKCELPREIYLGLFVVY